MGPGLIHMLQPSATYSPSEHRQWSCLPCWVTSLATVQVHRNPATQLMDLTGFNIRRVRMCVSYIAPPLLEGGRGTWDPSCRMYLLRAPSGLPCNSLVQLAIDLNPPHQRHEPAARGRLERVRCPLECTTSTSSGRRWHTVISDVDSHRSDAIRRPCVPTARMATRAAMARLWVWNAVSSTVSTSAYWHASRTPINLDDIHRRSRRSGGCHAPIHERGFCRVSSQRRGVTHQGSQERSRAGLVATAGDREAAQCERGSLIRTLKAADCVYARSTNIQR